MCWLVCYKEELVGLSLSPEMMMLIQRLAFEIPLMRFHLDILDNFIIEPPLAVLLKTLWCLVS